MYKWMQKRICLNPETKEECPSTKRIWSIIASNLTGAKLLYDKEYIIFEYCGKKYQAFAKWTGWGYYISCDLI